MNKPIPKVNRLIAEREVARIQGIHLRKLQQEKRGGGRIDMKEPPQVRASPSPRR